MSLWNECRFALRQLRRNPSFTLVVVGTLGLCIGANTAVFSVLDAVLLRPLPYPDPERLALVATLRHQDAEEELDNSQTGTQFEGVRDGAPGLDVAAYAETSGVNFAAADHVEYVRQQRVSAGYFHVLGVAPWIGREFTRAEDVAGGPALTILSQSFWMRAFHGDPAAVGRSIRLRGEPYTVVGIMPPEFRSEQPTDVWTPLRPSRTGEGAGTNYGVIARPRPGVSWAEADGQVRALSAALAGANLPRGAKAEERIVPLQNGVTVDVRSELMLTWAAVLAVLLIGCVNIAGLLLARSASRQREIATRMALGGGRSAIVRGLLIESLLLALGGCIVGIALGVFALDWLKLLGAEAFAHWRPIVLDLRVLLAMVAISVVTALLFGLAPALQTSRVDIRAVLVEGGRSSAGGRRRWSRQALVVAEVALSLVLLVSGGLLVKTLRYLDGLNPGFDARRVLTASASLEDARYKTSAAVDRLYTQSLNRIRRIPGVESAAVALTLPYERPLNDSFRAQDGDDRRLRGMELVYATPGYFDTMRIPMVRGREILASDTALAPKVLVVSQAFAARFFHGTDAIGHHLLTEGQSYEIVGVVGDVQQHSGLSARFGPLAVTPTAYVPVSQVSDGFLQVIHGWFSPKWVVRASGSLGGLSEQIQSAVAAVDSQLPIASFQTIDELEARSTRAQRYHAALFSILAGLALLLATLGLYGLISQMVAQRTRELGVRLALGANPGQVMASVLRSGMLLAVAGAVAGLAFSLLAVRLLQHLLWGVRPGDPLNLVVSTLILLLAAGLAALVPAARVLRLDPAATLREE